jgi:hypothetical protein
VCVCVCVCVCVWLSPCPCPLLVLRQMQDGVLVSGVGSVKEASALCQPYSPFHILGPAIDSTAQSVDCASEGLQLLLGQKLKPVYHSVCPEVRDRANTHVFVFQPTWLTLLPTLAFTWPI